MLVLPTALSQLLEAGSSKLSQFAEESLTKTESNKSRNAARLRIWDEVQNDLLHVQVNKHLSRKQLEPAEMAAVNAWLAPKD